MSVRLGGAGKKGRFVRRTQRVPPGRGEGPVERALKFVVVDHQVTGPLCALDGAVADE